jgi:hypothetical protein
MSTPTQTVRITHSWCPTCQGGAAGKARCGTPRSIGWYPAGTRNQACVVCRSLHWMPCERCGGDDR